jgi:hypothetical protein
MTELFALIERFQSLKNITGTSKIGSYQVLINFDPHSDKINIEWGCYDIHRYPRHYVTQTNKSNLIEHMQSEIKKMEHTVSLHA